MRRIVMWLDQRYGNCPYCLLNGTIFEKVTEHNMFVLISSTTFSKKFAIFRRIELDMIQKFLLVFM
jgi:hypothetical protein